MHNHKGQYLASGYINPKSQITVRIVGYRPIEEMTPEFFSQSVFPPVGSTASVF